MPSFHHGPERPTGHRLEVSRVQAAKIRLIEKHAWPMSFEQSARQ
jgi:hypothetical protein